MRFDGTVTWTLCHARSAVLTLAAGFAVAGSGTAHADGSPTPAPPSDVLTRFESFVLTACIPCVREFYHIATVPVPSVKTPSFPGVPALSVRANTRAGELRFELVRAYPVGLKSRAHMAMRLVLSVSGGSENQLYPLGTGLLDEDEVPVLEAALSQMEQSGTSETKDSSIQLIDMEFHVDSVRIGRVRTSDQNFAYVQVAPTDLPRFALKQVWELPALVLAADDIAALKRSVRQVNEKIRAIRAQAP